MKKSSTKPDATDEDARGSVVTGPVSTWSPSDLERGSGAGQYTRNGRLTVTPTLSDCLLFTYSMRSFSVVFTSEKPMLGSDPQNPVIRRAETLRNSKRHSP